MNRKDLIAEMKRIRVNNNDLWMKLLNIAADANPTATAAVLDSISDNDQKIVDACRGLSKHLRS